MALKWKLTKILFLLSFLIIIPLQSACSGKPSSRSCHSSADCLSNEICLDKICREKTECIWSSDCAQGKVCFDGHCVSKGRVQAECVRSTECQDGFLCQDGHCIKGCNKDSDCKSGEACQNHVCISINHYCTKDSDCTQGFMCVNRICHKVTPKSGCISNNDCASGELCVAGQCWPKKPECYKNEDCLSEQVCLKGKCLKPAKPCEEQCDRGAKRCQGYKIQFCEKLPSGCRAWGKLRNCPLNNICENDSCVPAAWQCRKSSECPTGQACYLLENRLIACKVIETPPIDAQCTVKIEKAQLDTRFKEDDGTPPDRYVVVEINGARYRTITKLNTFTPVWNVVLTKPHPFNDILYSMVIYMMEENSTGDEVKWSVSLDSDWKTKFPAKGESFKQKDSDGILYFSINCTF